MMDDMLSLKILMIMGFFCISLVGVIMPITLPQSFLEGKAMSILCSGAAGVMMGVALVSTLLYPMLTGY
jgi:hypothetical protein